MDINRFFQVKIFKWAIFSIAAFLIILLVFKVGMFVGVRKADFSCRWSDNYHRNFGGPRGGFLGGADDRDFIDAGGIFGQIIKIDSASSTQFIIKGRDDIEKVVLVDKDTIIKRLKDAIKFSDLRVDDYIVAIGEPNQNGQIAAKLIRVMPPPPAPLGSTHLDILPPRQH
jgi:hypothetical protein